MGCGRMGSHLDWDFNWDRDVDGNGYRDWGLMGLMGLDGIGIWLGSGIAWDGMRHLGIGDC